MLTVTVIGPGPGTPGGIGVMAGHLAATESARTRLEFVDPGSSRAPAAHRIRRFAAAAAACLLGPSAGDQVWVLSLASNGSTWRKLILSSLLRLRGRPHLLHLHGGGYPTFLAAQPRAAARLIRSMFRAARRVIVLGERWAQFVRAEVGVDPRRVALLPNAVPGPEQVPSREGAVRVLFSGRVGRRKGAAELLEAWARVGADHGATLVLAGDLDDPDGSLRAAVDSTPGVELTGWLDRSALTRQLAAASVVVLPSHAENLPLALLEGMAWGLAPVVTPVGSVPEVVTDGEDGLLVPVGDADALAAALSRLLTDDELRTRLGAQARRTWEQGYALGGYRDRFDDIVIAAAGAPTEEDS